MKRINMLFTITALGLLLIGCRTEESIDANNQLPKVSAVLEILNGRYVNISYTYTDAEKNTEDKIKRITTFYKLVDKKRVFQFKEIGPKPNYDLYNPDSPYKLGDDIVIGVIVTQGIGGRSTEAFSNEVKFTSDPPTVSDVKIDRAIFKVESTVSYTYSHSEKNSEDKSALKVTWYKVRDDTETKLEENMGKLTYRVSTGFESGDILRVKIQVKATEGNTAYSNVGTVDKTIDPLSYSIAAKITRTKNIGTANSLGTVHNTAASPSPKKFGEVLNDYLTNDLSTDESNFILEYRYVYKITIHLGDRRDAVKSRIDSYVIPNVETENSVALTLGGAAYPFKVTLTSDGSITVQDSHGGKPNKYGAVRGLTVTIP